MVRGNVVVIEKDSLRASYKRKLNDLSTNEKQAQSERVCLKLSDFLQNQTGTWTLFSPLNDEPNILKLIESCTHLNWVFPRVVSKEIMKFFRVTTPDELVTSCWGLEEPPADPARVVDQSEINGCLIPGIAFDSEGTRLGRGGGFYDRFLENFKGQKLGVTFIQGMTTETLPRRSHDQQMNIVISPEHWIEVEASEVLNGY